MADTTSSSSWSGMQPFIDAIFGSSKGSANSTPATFDKIIAGMNRMTPRHTAQSAMPPPPMGAPPMVGPGGSAGGPFVGDTVPGPMPSAQSQIPGLSIKPVNLTGSLMPTPLQGIGSVPQTSNPFTTGAPNPTGSRIS